ncbi:MAG: CBS domain-containing protein [Methanomicrobiales archaeon]|nr:CBS domain-containing protein [Methanomicrobiales archaeon]
MIASDLMASPVYIVGPDENTAHARNLMLKHRISRLPVMDGESLAGIITKKDIGYRLRQAEPVWRRRPIDRIPVNMLMTPDPVTVQPGTGIRSVAAIMVDRGFSGIPVLEERRLVGIVTKSDLLNSALLGSLTVTAGEIMEDAVTVSRYHSLDHVIDLMAERNDKIIVTNADGTLAGIITETNLAFYSFPEGSGGVPEHGVKRLRKEEPAGRKSLRHVVSLSAVAEDLMSGPVISITPDEPVLSVINLMRDSHVNSIVVMDEGKIRGIVKRDDILREVAK